MIHVLGGPGQGGGVCAALLFTKELHYRAISPPPHTNTHWSSFFCSHSLQVSATCFVDKPETKQALPPFWKSPPPEDSVIWIKGF